MKNLLSKRQEEQPMSYAHLRLIWYVDADSTYYVEKIPGSRDSDYIAVRTIGGCGVLREFSGKWHELRANTIAVFRSEDVKEYYTDGDNWNLYWFRFDHQNWQGEVNRVIELSMHSSEQSRMELCFAYLNSTIPEESRLAEAMFNYLLLDWTVRQKTDCREELSRQKLIALLERGWHERISVNILAREAGMSERSFRNTVHRLCGMSPKEYIVKMKMEAAMELLQTTNKSVTEIAADLDFENPFYFSRVFKKYYGTSPKLAREEALSETLREIP